MESSFTLSEKAQRLAHSDECRQIQPEEAGDECCNWTKGSFNGDHQIPLEFVVFVDPVRSVDVRREAFTLFKDDAAKVTWHKHLKKDGWEVDHDEHEPGEFFRWIDLKIEKKRQSDLVNPRSLVIPKLVERRSCRGPNRSQQTERNMPNSTLVPAPLNTWNESGRLR